MRRIGVVASGSTVLDAGVILAEGEEKSVKAEDLEINFYIFFLQVIILEIRKLEIHQTYYIENAIS